MKIPRKYRHEYVSCLPISLERQIMNTVKSVISSLLLSDTEKIEAIENANCSKVCDLTDTISIQFI